MTVSGAFLWPLFCWCYYSSIWQVLLVSNWYVLDWDALGILIINQIQTEPSKENVIKRWSMIDHWGGVFRQSEDSSQTGVSSSHPSRETQSIVPKIEIPTSNQTDIFSKRTQLLFHHSVLFKTLHAYMQKAGDCGDISPQFFWIFRKILGWEREINTAPKPSPEVAPS